MLKVCVDEEKGGERRGEREIERERERSAHPLTDFIAQKSLPKGCEGFGSPNASAEMEITVDCILTGPFMRCSTARPKAFTT